MINIFRKKKIDHKKNYELLKKFWTLPNSEREEFLKVHRQIFMTIGLGSLTQYPNILLPNGALTQIQNFSMTSGTTGGYMYGSTSYQCTVPYKLSFSMQAYFGTISSVQNFNIGLLVRDSISTSTVTFNTTVPTTIGNFLFLGAQTNTSYPTFFYPVTMGNYQSASPWGTGITVGSGGVIYVIQELTPNNIQVSYNGLPFTSTGITGNILNGNQRSIGLLYTGLGTYGISSNVDIRYIMIASPI